MFNTLHAFGPILQPLWISFDSINADFFAMTLVFVAVQQFLLTDSIFGKMKRNFLLENAIDLEIEGKYGTLDMELRYGKHCIWDLFLEEFFLVFYAEGLFLRFN